MIIRDNGVRRKPQIQFAANALQIPPANKTGLVVYHNILYIID